MIFTNEDAMLYICRYLHPDDVAALARASRDVRATIVPHMRYEMGTTTFSGLYHSIIRTDIIRPRFERRDTTFEIVPGNDIIRPNPIPHDYTGVISIQRHYIHGAIETYTLLWASAGIVRRDISWRQDEPDNIYVAAIGPVHFIGYFCGDIGNAIYMVDPLEHTIAELIRNARTVEGFESSDEFQKLLCQIDSL